MLADVPPQFWVKTAPLHFDGVASQWLQVYKKKNNMDSWIQFVLAVETKFGQDDYRKVLTDLLELRQETSVNDYFVTF